MLLSSQVLFPETDINRNLPVNFHLENLTLFECSLTARAWGISLRHYTDLTANTELFLKQSIKILPESFGDAWQTNVYNAPLYLAKSFIKDRLRRNTAVPEALWCLDTFSTGGYFHWITEILPRLWIASQHVDNAVPFYVPRYFLTKWKFGDDLLKPFNRPVVAYDENQLLKIGKTTIITQPGGPLNYQPEPLAKSTEILKKYYYDARYPQAFDKIYISRKKNGRRTILNEDKLCDLIRGYGYTLLYLEDLSVYDQVNLFSRAREIMSIHGAGLTNMVFMEEGRVIEIRQNLSSHMLNFFFTLSHSLRHQYYYSLGQLPDASEKIVSHDPRPESASLHADLADITKILDSF